MREWDGSGAFSIRASGRLNKSDIGVSQHAPFMGKKVLQWTL
jgi:hypothetical protein